MSSSTESKEKKNNGSGGNNTNPGKKNNQNNKKQNQKIDYAERVKTLYPPGTRSTGNAGQWLDYHLTVLRGKFGKMVSDLSVTNKFEREEPVQPDDVDLQNDPHGLKKAKAIKKFELFWRLQQEDEQKFEQMYSILWGAMSTASQQLLREQAEFADIERACDPHLLVQLVKNTHMCIDVYSKPEIKKHNLMSYYFNQLRQFGHESLTDFKVRFEMFVETSFKDAGMEAKKPEPSEAAWHFIHRLNEQKYPNIAEETVEENEKKFTKAQVKRAREARRLSACLGHESDYTLWKILHKGSYRNMKITPDDIRRAHEIYGPSVPMLKGTATHKRQETKIPYQIEYNATKDQRLHIDIMFINEMGFLVSVSKPLNLTMCQKLASKKSWVVKNALQKYNLSFSSNLYSTPFPQSTLK